MSLLFNLIYCNVCTTGSATGSWQSRGGSEWGSVRQGGFAEKLFPRSCIKTGEIIQKLRRRIANERPENGHFDLYWHLPKQDKKSYFSDRARK